MRAWLLVTFLAVFAVGGVVLGPRVASSAHASRCDRPLTYDVVRVDAGHHVSRAAFVALLERSERIWEIPAGRDLFRYQPGGEVHVSLIYDGRQALEDRIGADDASLGLMRADVEREKTAVQAEHTKLVAREQAHSASIEHWNALGGAPPDTFAAPKAEDAAIALLVTAFNERLRHERVTVDRFNAAVNARNALVRSRGNSELRLGQAQIGGTEVLIFALTGTAKDESLIAYELGHSLGVGHVPGAGNVMNPTRVKALTRASTADLHALERTCAGH